MGIQSRQPTKTKQPAGYYAGAKCVICGNRRPGTYLYDRELDAMICWKHRYPDPDQSEG